MGLDMLDAEGNKINFNNGKIEKLDERLDLFSKGFGTVEKWDFSSSNSSQEKRVEAATRVASVCYGSSDTVIGSEKLYDQLYTESIGLPSSAFEFIPVMLNQEDYWFLMSNFEAIMDKEPEALQQMHVDRYGFTVPMQKKKTILIEGEPDHDLEIYKLTNLRALIRDVKLLQTHFGEMEELDLTKHFFNTDPDEIAFIGNLTKVFRMDIDIVTARQLMRHRTSWQELSRRYTSGKKVPFSVYNNSEVTEASSTVAVGNTEIGTDELNTLCIEMYDKLVADGVKPQAARRVIPQGAMTNVWSAWNVPQLFEMFQLRTSAKAQDEVRALAKAMHSMAT